MGALKVRVELGAGTGAFRDRFLPGAWTTDLKLATGINLLADATQLSFQPESVDGFIVNNPHQYEFRFIGEGIKFLEEIRVVLKFGGRFVVRANSRNSYADRNRIEQVVSHLGLQVEVKTIDAATEFPNHTFLTTSGRRTVPNLEFVIFKEGASE